MRNKIVCSIVFLVIGLTSCDEWLDVSPKSEIKAGRLFETESGFKDALIGIYIGMTDRKSYGENLSWGAMEFLAAQYQTPNGEFGQFQKYNYEDNRSKAIIDGIWAKQYYLISEINFLLESLDKNPDKLNPTVFNVIKGEALALRAMCHFDLIRLFAKGNLANNKGALSELCIPYVTEYTKVITGQKSYQETLALLHKDIDEALKYLVSDPLYPEPTDRPADYEDITEDDPFFDGTYYKGRETRMSYPAVLLLNARVYHWEGDKTNALANAEKLIAAFKKYVADGSHVWATESSYVSASKTSNSKDFVFAGELLFSLEVTKLPEYLEFAYSTTKHGNQNYDRLIQPLTFVQDIYNFSTGEANSDLRYQNWYEDIPEYSGRWTIKIKKTEGKWFTNLIPLMRISEAYLIAAECMMETNKSKAIGYMNFLKEKRKISENYYLPDNITGEELEKAIIKEYRKEFGQEGQLFFCYKRLGLKTFDGIQFVKGDMGDEQYRLPYPVVEQDLGQRQ